MFKEQQCISVVCLTNWDSPNTAIKINIVDKNANDWEFLHLLKEKKEKKESERSFPVAARIDECDTY